jgi:predicted nucleotide-binding protein
MTDYNLTEFQKELLGILVEAKESGQLSEPIILAESFVDTVIIGIDRTFDPGLRGDFQALVDEDLLGARHNSNGNLIYSIRQKGYDAVSTNFSKRATRVTNPASESPIPIIGDGKKVFVVHGRHEELRKSMFDFLRSIGLHPIEWSEARHMTGETSPYVGAILDSAFNNAQAMVVLLNGEELVKLHPDFVDQSDEKEGAVSIQPRPNVLFEAGMAMGKDSRRTILVQVGMVREFSDIAGRHTVRLDNSTEKRQELAHRLIDAGCDANLRGTDWHKTGNFESELILSVEEIESSKQIISSSKTNEALPLDQLGISILQIVLGSSGGLINNIYDKSREWKDIKFATFEYYINLLEFLKFVRISGVYVYCSDLGVEFLVKNNLTEFK